VHLRREERAAHHLPHLRVLLPLPLVSPAHRRTGGLPPEDNAHRTSWFEPTCWHELGHPEGEMPLCGRRPCLWRWWRRYGIPALALLVGLTVYLSIGYSAPPCPPGWEPLGLGDCIRR
jgi:hypothetical protein